MPRPDVSVSPDGARWQQRCGLPLSVERRLIEAAQAGDASARAQVVDAFTPLIAGVARRYKARGLHRSELMQQGTLGLLRALSRYEPDRGTPFWGYASWWVRQAMQEIVAELTLPVVLSDRAFRQLATVKQARREYVQAHRCEPSTADLIESTGLPRSQVENLVAADRPARALEAPLGADDNATQTLGDLVADARAEDAYERVVDRCDVELLRDVRAGLCERERQVLRARFGIGRPQRTLRQIGDGFGVSAERVRQIEQGALGKLRDAVDAARRRP